MGEDSPAPRRSGRGAALLAATVLAAAGGGALVWMLSRGEPAPPADMEGFDIARAPEPSAAYAPAAAARHPEPEPASGLAMLKGDPGIRAAGPEAASAPSAAPGRAGRGEGAAPLSLAQAARKHERLVSAFGWRMTRKHPSIRQYGRDWASHPELRQLTAEYARHRDPVRFMAGLARSPNFPKLVAKYALDPGVRDFVISGAREAPAELMTAALDYLQNDAGALKVVENAARAMGLSGNLSSIFQGRGGSLGIDSEKILSNAASQAPPAR